MKPAERLEDLIELVCLGAVALDETGATAFERAADLPGTVRYRVTDRGKRNAERPKGEDLAIEEAAWFCLRSESPMAII